MTQDQQRTMRQTAPFPTDLADLVERCTYRPGWSVQLRDVVRDHVDAADDSSAKLAGGLTLTITTRGYDSYHPDRGDNYRVLHLFVVPAATYTRESWQRWLFERFRDVELHEAMEFFTVDDAKPFAPNHGPGEDPYVVHDPTTGAARATSFRGVHVGRPDRGAQALRDAADAARAMHNPVAPDCAEWADWLDERASRLQ